MKYKIYGLYHGRLMAYIKNSQCVADSFNIYMRLFFHFEDLSKRLKSRYVWFESLHLHIRQFVPALLTTGDTSFLITSADP